MTQGKRSRAIAKFVRSLNKLVKGDDDENVETELFWETIRPDGICVLYRVPVPGAADIRCQDLPGDIVDISTKTSPLSCSGDWLTSQLPIRLDMSYDCINKKEQLGAGSCGRVFAATMEGQEVALKELPLPSEMDNPKRVEEVMRKELTILCRVGHHPNVVKCLGGSVTGPKLFIVSELKKGGSLGALIHRGGPDGRAQRLPVARALQIMVDILKGLDHLHSLSPMVVHRDLKPDNVLLEEDGTACVADFGLSRSKASTYVNTSHHHDGTPRYLAPETLDEKVDEKVDIYAVGVILWECLTGETPWRGEIPAVVLPKVYTGKRLEFPAEVFPEGEDHPMTSIKVLIECCWDENPRNRPSCKELIADIRMLQAQFPQFRSNEARQGK